MIKFVEANVDLAAIRHKHAKLAELPFNSTNKFQLSVHAVSANDAADVAKDVDVDEDAESGRRRRRGKTPTTSAMLFMKGAIERVLERCTTTMINGVAEPMTAARRAEIERAADDLGKRGERVMAFAQRALDKRFGVEFDFDVDALNFPTDELTLVGLVSFIDPPRESVPSAIVKCHEAGLRVIMVTGDHPLTALAIAREIGIVRGVAVDDVATATSSTLMWRDARNRYSEFYY